MQPMVSVVMAAYNAEGTVARAIASVLEQRVPLELVVVDDRSADATAATVEELARAAGGRIRLQRHEENRGAAAARNTGVEAARGEFVCFVDSDDEMLPGYLEVLLTAARDASADIAIGNVVYQRQDGSRAERPARAVGVFQGAEAARLALLDRIAPFTCDKLVRRSLFADVRFPEGLINEDFLTNPVLQARAGRVVVTDRPVYLYRVRDSSVTWSAAPDPRDLDRSAEYLRANLLGPDAAPALLRAVRHAVVFLTLMNGQRALLRDPADPVVLEYRRRLRRPDVLRVARDVPFTTVAASLFALLPRLYRRLYLARVTREYRGSRRAESPST